MPGRWMDRPKVHDGVLGPGVRSSRFDPRAFCFKPASPLHGQDGWAFKLISPAALFESGGRGLIICLLLSGV